MFFFDKQIAQLAERILIRPRNIDYRTNVFVQGAHPGGARGRLLGTIRSSTLEPVPLTPPHSVALLALATRRIPLLTPLPRLPSCCLTGHARRSGVKPSSSR